MTYYSSNNWATMLDDAHGNTWHFQYRGGSTIRIRPASARPEDWTHLISIADQGMAPHTVTDAWLTERTAEWIADRKDDPAETRTVA